MNPLGLYLHIPFCVRKCRYCDFRSFPVAEAGPHEAYTRQLVREIAGRKAAYSGYEADTVYVGGGTPSLLMPERMEEILDAVYANYPVAENAEITIEVNPGAVTPEKFRAYREMGVNRVSIGAQSFDAGTLSFLGRIHTVQDTLCCFRDAEAAGFENISLDLIFGVPGQTLAQWEADLKTAVNLAPAHISFYSLQIEEGTPLFADVLAGRIAEADELLDRRMYHLAIGMLTGAGYEHYEISNSAKPGCASRHNLKYWSMDAYAGFGLAAHSYSPGGKAAFVNENSMGKTAINEKNASDTPQDTLRGAEPRFRRTPGRRFSNTDDLVMYLSAGSAQDMTDWEHENSRAEDMSEFIFLGLRRTAGIELACFQETFGCAFMELYGEETRGLIGRGLLEWAAGGGTLRLTALGLDLANRVFREYV